METLSFQDQVVHSRPVVPGRSGGLHPSSIPGASARYAAGNEGIIRHVFMCDCHFPHHRLHFAYESAVCELQPVEDPFVRAIAVVLPHVRDRVCGR